MNIKKVLILVLCIMIIGIGVYSCILNFNYQKECDGIGLPILQIKGYNGTVDGNFFIFCSGIDPRDMKTYYKVLYQKETKWK